MKSYKDVKRRIMALVVAAATILSSITITMNSQAESVDGVSSGGAVAQVFCAQCSANATYVKLTSVALKLHMKAGQNVSCTATIHRNLTDGNPYSDTDIVCGTDAIPSVTASEEGEESITITPSEDIYLTNGEMYSVVVTFESNMNIVYLTENGTGAYIMNPGETYWEAQSYSAMTATETEVDGSPADETFTVTLNPAVVCVDKADVADGAKNFAFQAVLTPAYQRTVKYTVPENTAFTITEAGAVSFTGGACGSATVTASVDGDAAKGTATATVTVVEAKLDETQLSYSGEALMPAVTFNDGVDTNGFDYKYENNIAAGEASVTITGKKNTIYEGYSHQIPFTIQPLSITQDNVKNGSFTIDTETDTVTNASITTDTGVELVYNSERQDFDVVASKTGSKIESGKLKYTYTITVTGQGNSSTNGALTTTVDAEAVTSDSGKIDISTLLNIELTSEKYTYNGKEIIPEYTATLAGSPVTVTDIADVKGSVDASKTATVTFTGKGNYTGTITKTFVIDKCSLDKYWSQFVLDVEKDAVTNDYIYIKTGEPINPKVTLKYNNGDETVVLDSKDYSVEYRNCIYPGQMLIYLKGNGNFTGSHLFECKIVGDLTKDVIWSIDGYEADEDFNTGYTLTYTGSAQDVTVDGSIDGQDLDPAADFSVKCTSNTRVGTAKATVTGKGDYAGQEVTITYKIVKAPLANFGELWIDPDGEWIYTGDPITLSSTECMIKDGDKASSLKAGTDYELSYENNVNAGIARVTAKAKEDSNYTGSLSGVFTISPLTLSASDTNLTVNIESLVYNGFPQKPDVTLSYNGQEIDNSNYKVSATDNVKIGTGKVTITGKNNLTGEVEYDFTILPKTLQSVEWNVGGTGFNQSRPSGYEVEYTGLPQRPSIELRDGDTKLVKGEDYDVAYQNNTKPGTAADPAQIIITWKNGYKDNAQTIVEFVVTKKDISADNAKVKVTYNGNKPKDTNGKVFPEITVVDEGLESGTKTLVEGTDYVLEASDKTGDDYDLTTSGAAKKAVVKGCGDYYTGELEVTYEVGTSLQTGDYFVRLKDPYTREIVTPDEDGIARFYYLGEGANNRPEATLYYDDPASDEEPTEVSTSDTDMTYTSSLGEGANLNSVYTASNPNIVTVSFKGKNNYYGVVNAQYLLRPTGIGGEKNNVIAVTSKKLGTFESTVCSVPYTGDIIGADEIADDMILTYKFSDTQKTVLTYQEDYYLEIAGSASKIGDTVTVKVYGQGNYNGYQEFTYMIVQRNLELCNVPEDGNGMVYNYTGEPIYPVTKVYDPDRKVFLVSGVDYKVICDEDITLPGKKGFTIEGIGNYQGTLIQDVNAEELHFTINSKTLSEDTIRIENFHPTWTYTGESVTQTEMYVIYVGDGTESIPLTKDSDYTVTYSPEDPTGPGKVTMTIKGINVFGGSVSKDYYIQADMSSEMIEIDYTATKQYVVNPDGTMANFDETDFTLKYKDEILVKGTDYTIDLTECTTPGEHNVVFKGIGKYAGQKAAAIKLYGDLSQATVKGAANSYVYTGSEVGPETVMVYYGENYLVDAANYTITRSNNTTVGTATLMVSPNAGTYYLENKTKTISYAICYDLSEIYTELEIAGAPHLYDKDGVEPQITVTCKANGALLTKGQDYEVTYSGNTKAGTAYVTITPVTGRSINSQIKSFEIQKIDISSAAVSWKTGQMPANNEVEYKGTEWKPEVEVVAGGNTLTYDVDYNVIYANNKNVGEATVTVVGKGNYSGKIENAKTFTITPASLNDDENDNLNIVVGDTYYNRGKAQPEIEVNFYGKKLTAGVDYDYEVVSPDAGSDGVMYPTTTSYVEFKPHTEDGVEPNFKDTWQETFEIKAINLNNSGLVTLENNTVEYTGQVIPEQDLDIQVVCRMDGQDEPYTLVKGEDYTITQMESKEIKDVGTYKIKVEGIGGFTGSWDDLAFEVTPRDLSAHVAVTLESVDMPYNDGEAVEPKVLAVAEEGEDALLDDNGTPVQLVEGVDYEVSYENNKNSASREDPDESKRPTVVINGKGNYEGTEMRVYFNIGTNIAGANVSLNLPAEGYTYNGEVQKPDLNSVTLNGITLKKDVDYVLTEDGDFTNAGEKHINIEGIGAYYGTAFGTYTIEKSAATDKIDIKLGGLNYNKETKEYSTTYTGSAIVPTVTVYDEAISKKTPLAEGDDYTVNVMENVNAGKAFVYVTLSKNYTGEIEKVMTFEILCRDISDDFELVFDKKKYEYEDSEIVPDIKVMSKTGITPSVELKELEEYNISSLSNNVNAGIANVTVEGAGNYTGTLSGEFMIVAALDDPNPDFTSIEIAEQFYTGEEVTPSVSIHCGGNDLEQEVDFHVENKWSKSDPYHGTAIITSKQEYYTCETPIKVEYTLAYGADYLQVTGFANEYTYTRSEIKPSFKITDLSGKEIDAEKLNYDPANITYKNLETGREDCINVGPIEATIPVSVDGQDEILLRAVYQIIPKNINDCSITKADNNTYNGSAIEPAVAIVYNGHELTKNQEFTESYTNNINPGTATVVLQGTGNYTGQCSMHFKIEPACMINLTASTVSESAIRIGWVRNAKVTGYEIYSADGKKKYGTTSGNNYVVEGLNSATSYSFKVRSYVTINGVTSYGEALQVTAYTKVPGVSATVSSNASGTATLVWNRYTSVGGYEVYRSTSSNGSYRKIATVPNAYGTYTDTKVKSGNTYYYKVRAYKPMNGVYSYGDFSEEIKITIK